MNFQPFTILRKMVQKDEDHHLGKGHTRKFPHRISDYLKNHFEKSFVSDIKKVRDKRGQVFYNVSLSHDHTLYRLKFNDEGVMVLKEAEPLLELDNDEYEVIED